MSASQNSNDPETSFALRNLALRGSRAAFELTGSFTTNEPWGVLMETSYPEGSATLVALSDRSASIYLSSSGGTIGGIGQETIRKAAQRMVQIALEFRPQMKKTTTFPLPRTGETIFYVLTDDGILFASA